MSYPSIVQDIQELQTFQANLINLIYPVGSIYMSVNNVSPQTFLGGTWEQIQDRFLLSAGSSYSAGSTGGEASHTLSVEETPAHTHTRGTMEITGYIEVGDHSFKVGLGNGSGALYTDSAVVGATVAGSSGSTWASDLQFQASRSWTGETSSVGLGEAHNNMPPYLTVYMWKRIS